MAIRPTPQSKARRGENGIHHELELRPELLKELKERNRSCNYYFYAKFEEIVTDRITFVDSAHYVVVLVLCELSFFAVFVDFVFNLAIAISFGSYGFLSTPGKLYYHRFSPSRLLFLQPFFYSWSCSFCSSAKSVIMLIVSFSFPPPSPRWGTSYAEKQGSPGKSYHTFPPLRNL